jgi:hypothetical protein
MAAKTSQFTVRAVPAAVNRALRQKARERKVSLNQILLEALTREAGVSTEPRLHHDLDELFGSWVDDPAVDRALAEQRRVDPKDWK